MSKKKKKNNKKKFRVWFEQEINIYESSAYKQLSEVGELMKLHD